MEETAKVFLVEVTKNHIMANVYDEEFNIVTESGIDINKDRYTRPKEVKYNMGDQLYLTEALINGPFKGCVRKVMRPVEMAAVERPILREEEPEPPKKLTVAEKRAKKEGKEAEAARLKKKEEADADVKTGEETPGEEKVKLTAAEQRAKKATGDKEQTLADAIPKA